MHPDAVALTTSSSRSLTGLSVIDRDDDYLLLARIDHRAVLVVADDAHHRALRIEAGALAITEAPRRALGADRADVALGGGDLGADLLLIERTGTRDGGAEQMQSVPAVG